MSLASAEQADFSNIAEFDASDNLYISKVLHKTFIQVDESGTEAAGATAVIMVERSSVNTVAPSPVKADHPFMFMIRDDTTGSILFLGKLVNPEK